MGKDKECCGGEGHHHHDHEHGEGGCCRGEGGSGRCKNKVKVGQPAPCFTATALCCGEDKTVSLKDYRGKWLFLFFYPLDFSGVCQTDVAHVDAKRAEFEALGCEVVAASTDSMYSHRAWAEKEPAVGAVKHPLISDGSHCLAKAYGVLLPDMGVALRGSFLIDPDGVLQWSQVNSLHVGRNVSEVLRVLSALKTGGFTPCDWQPGEKTL